jgi:hypothetical protein
VPPVRPPFLVDVSDGSRQTESGNGTAVVTINDMPPEIFMTRFDLDDDIDEDDDDDDDEDSDEDDDEDEDDEDADGETWQVTASA